jgi:hypothetical protein
MHNALPVDAQSDSAPIRPQRPRSSPVARAAHPRSHRSLQVTTAEGSGARGTDYVTISVAAAITGYSAKAIRRKIESGIWLEGREFRRAPDGHVLISVKGYELWVERGRA